MHCNRGKNKHSLIFCYFLSVILRASCRSNDEDHVFEWIEPRSCDSSKNEYFDTDSFECKKCPNDLVLSDDGYGCVCDKESKIVAFKEGHPVCAFCGSGKIHTTDGHDCISCRKNGSCGCLENEITVERNWNGTILDVQQCLPCTKNTFSTLDHSQCLPCFAVWSKDDRDYWPLDHSSHDSLIRHCMPINALKDWPDLQSTYIVKFPKKNINVDSYLFRNELKFTFYSCKNGIEKACIQLANMCSLTLFASNGIACKFFFMNKIHINNRSKLFYHEGETRNFLNRRTITQRYTLDQKNLTGNRLKLVAATFGLRGRFDAITEPNIPCSFFINLPFGVNLSKKCKISAIELVNEKMSFLAPYLAYFDNNNVDVKLLHPVAVFIKNINEHVVSKRRPLLEGVSFVGNIFFFAQVEKLRIQINREIFTQIFSQVLLTNSAAFKILKDEHDLASWRLVGRFFTIDKITGFKAMTNSKNASFAKGTKLKVLRYIKSLSLVVKLQERSERGKIFPPLLILEYDELTSREIIENVEIHVEYKVTYSFPDDETNIAVEVCIGVFTGLAIAYSLIRVWSYSRRSGKNLASIATVTWFFVYYFGAMGNILLIICSSSSVYTFVFYKGQKIVHTLLPDRANEWTIRVCTMVAFVFKTVEILALIYQQRKINIFFIDWEQPKAIFDVSNSMKLDSPRPSLGKYASSMNKSNSSNERKTSMQTASEIIGARRKKIISSPTRSASQASTSSSRESIKIKEEEKMDNLSMTSKIGQKKTIATVCSEKDFSVEDQNNDEEKNYSVSIWRTCVVANEWLRIKTTRKINILLQILVTSFILEIVGGKYLSKAIPQLTLEIDEMLYVDDSFTLEYAVGILIYLTIYIVQWWFSVFLYQKYMKNELQEFVDLCSMANISVFILSQDYYGYYIHGRSVHGFADTDLLTLIKDLKREENNVCAHRGLIPGTTEQTFVISVSKTFRTFYDRLLGTQNSRNGKFLRNVSHGPANWDERWRTHLRLRKFLSGFLDHCYKNVDYTVRERHFLEKMCDLGITDVEEKSIFYVDNAYSFGETIFHGNERTLATFEINVFLLVLVFGGNYILALFAALLAAKAVTAIVKFNGKRLLAEKTFVDERFLVSQ